MYHEVAITPCPAGFGEYQVGPSDGEGWAVLSDLEAAMAESVALYELGIDAMPAGTEDIRGRIHCEPQHVYAMQYPDGSVGYCGVSEY